MCKHRLSTHLNINDFIRYESGPVAMLDHYGLLRSPIILITVKYSDHHVVPFLKRFAIYIHSMFFRFKIFLYSLFYKPSSFVKIFIGSILRKKI